ncbi:MAG: caspase family protein [Candidatus Competibacteraceae bacterium]
MKKHHSFLSITHDLAGIGWLFGLLVLGMPVLVSAADVYGLVIGINDYKTFSTLDGAVNDAQDIADALNKIGAKQVILLQDKAADRDTIFSKWKSLTSQAKKGDILVFAYAGHGSQEPEHVANSESDGRDENFILADFAERDRSSYQRIVDDEIDALFRETPDLKILFIADSCHSGTMTRAFAAPKKFKKRSIPPLNIQNDALTVLYGKSRGEKNVSANPGKEGGTDSEVAANVFGFSGVPDHEQVEEITDPDTKKFRGALSMAFAKVLRFDATNKEQTISKERLQHLVTENVRMITEGRQALQVAGSIDFSIPINAKPSPANTTDTKPSTDDKVTPTTPVQQSINFTVFVDNVPDAVAENQWRPILGQAKITSDKQTANAIWDIGREKIFSQLGDLVYDGRQPKVQETRAFSRAQSKTPAPAGSVEIVYATKVFDKLIAVERIKKRSETVSPTMVLKPNDRLHRAGEQVTLETSNQQYPYLTLFNIASDGTINNLYPLKEGNINDPLEVPVDKPYGLLLNVEPPYGSDHFVVIFSEKPLTGLHKDLQGMNGGQNANQIEVALDRHLQGIKHQIGIHGVFTGS